MYSCTQVNTRLSPPLPCALRRELMEMIIQKDTHTAFEILPFPYSKLLKRAKFQRLWHFISRRRLVEAGRQAGGKMQYANTGLTLNSAILHSRGREFSVIKTEDSILRSWTCLFCVWLILFRVAERLLRLGAAARCAVCCGLWKQMKLLMEVTAAFVCGVSFLFMYFSIMCMFTWFSWFFPAVC